MLAITPDCADGGAERLVVDLARHVDATSVEMLVLSLFGRSATHNEQLLDTAGIEVVFLEKRKGPDLSILPKLVSQLNRIRPDVVHTHRYALAYATLPLISQRIPAVHTVHSIAHREVGRIARSFHRLAFRAGVVPVATADRVRDSVVQMYGRRDCAVIPNGIPVASFADTPGMRSAYRAALGFGPGDRVFACVARLSPEKNHGMLLSAFAEGRSGDARLLLIGDGPLRGCLAAEADRLGLNDCVHFTGYRTDIPELLAASDAFILASRYEGNPLSVLEAMAAGLPVVATAVGGIPELLMKARAGVVVPPDDKAALAAAIRTACFGRWAHASRDDIRAAAGRFDTRFMAAAYAELYWRAAAIRLGGFAL